MTARPTRERAPLEPGTVLDDRFEIVEFLGKGAFAEVYRARQLIFGRSFRDVALKLFTEDVVTAENAAETLNDALVLLGLLEESPDPELASHLVQVYDMGVVATPAPRAFMSMRLIPERTTLRSDVYRFRHAGGMPVSLSLRYMRELLLPLSWMHSLEQKVVHGDLKPENVMLTRDARLVLVDFGLAARMPVGVRGGTIAYDAPEKLEGELGGPEADVYSIGVMWYELLTGQHPFKDVGLDALARGDSAAYTQEHLAARRWPICSRDQLPVQQQQQRIVPASEVNEELAGHHPQIEILLNTCLAPDIPERFANARLLLDHITRYIEEGSAFSTSELEVIGARQKARQTAVPPTPQEKTVEARLTDAGALIVQGKPEQAVAIADGVLRASPQSVPALLAKARALAAMSGRLLDADDVCGQAMALAPKDPGVFRTLADIRQARGKREQAAGFRKQADEIERTRRAGRGY